MTAFALSDVEVVFPTEKTVVLIYQVKQTVAAREGGKSTTQNMSVTSTWVHADKRWQCFLHTELQIGREASMTNLSEAVTPFMVALVAVTHTSLHVWAIQHDIGLICLLADRAIVDDGVPVAFRFGLIDN